MKTYQNIAMLVLLATALNCSKPSSNKYPGDIFNDYKKLATSVIRYNTNLGNKIHMATDSLEYYRKQGIRLMDKEIKLYLKIQNKDGFDYLEAEHNRLLFVIDSLFPVQKKVEFWDGYNSAIDSLGIVKSE